MGGRGRRRGRRRGRYRDDGSGGMLKRMERVW